MLFEVSIYPRVQFGPSFGGVIRNHLMSFSFAFRGSSGSEDPLYGDSLDEIANCELELGKRFALETGSFQEV